MALSQLAVSLRRLVRDEEAAASVDESKQIVITDAEPKANWKKIRIVPVQIPF